MFTNLEFALSASVNLGLGEDRFRQEATRAFNLALGRGRMGHFWARILRRSNSLQTLSAQPVTHRRLTSRIVAIPIQHIQGTLGRSADFDANFNPLHERTRSRWISVATAMRQAVPLPPVELVQVGQAFFVQDGHHRISVARTLGQEVIEARIVN